MTFGIKPRTCDEYKDIVHLDNKEEAIEYFSIKLKLNKTQMLKLYQVMMIRH